MVEDVLDNVNLDIIEVKEVLEIVNLYVILVIFFNSPEGFSGRACATTCVAGFSDEEG